MASTAHPPPAGRICLLPSCYHHVYIVVITELVPHGQPDALPDAGAQ